MALEASADRAIPTDAAVIVSALNKSFDAKPVLTDLALELRAGEFVALLGRSGSGKSTLLRVLGALDKEVEGYIRVPRRRAVVFQEPRLMPWLPVLRNVTMGLPQTASTKTKSRRALAEVGLEHKA
ncbi:ABC-type nitrate/sulfonate/bicarbonate transport system ATPase subunit [Bradyrhizobium elkanii]|uniref:ATP-binding cassette domain-containing protein n=1 Tax=Bradyrhizobium TaxID=374 RepID=UPI00216A8E9A|nr:MULTISPECIES: ATP-binding cassette domain-containing protein [Bradyrhizobium]MCS3926279.1 ABC-type nitrate/sulfonate/bicarbonate transport system ATPase subunit [Bradyrhizobium elkanii]MCS3966830.1 ABC-type nitrate/sulfonate/bicarbonate transport system ATPase subunit [Bradyrhizobium japonicum]